MANTSTLRFKAFASANEVLETNNLQIITQKDDRGTMIASGNAVVHFATELENAISAFVALKNALESIGPKVNRITAEFLPNVANQKIQQEMRIAAAPFQGAMDAGRHYSEQAAKERAKWEMIPAATDPVAEAAVRESYHALPDFSAKLAALQNWPIESLFAVLRAGRQPLGLDEAIWDAVMARVRAYNLTLSHKTTFIKKPDLANPIARGTDDKALAAYVESEHEKFAEKQEIIALARSTLQHVAVLVGVMTEQTPEQAFAMLAGEAQ